VERWYLGLCKEDPQTADGIADAIEQLVDMGPALGRPLVDRIHGSRHHNMKEVRPPRRVAVRSGCLFAFDPEREAVFLVAGDKAGSWTTWYRDAIPVADDRFDEHLAEVRRRREPGELFGGDHRSGHRGTKETR